MTDEARFKKLEDRIWELETRMLSVLELQRDTILLTGNMVKKQQPVPETTAEEIWGVINAPLSKSLMQRVSSGVCDSTKK